MVASVLSLAHGDFVKKINYVISLLMIHAEKTYTHMFDHFNKYNSPNGLYLTI